MAEPDTVMDDDHYASSEDSDFAPEDAPNAASVADSDSEDDAVAKTVAPNSQQTGRAAAAGKDEEAEDAGFENSGDEAVIGKGKKRQRKHGDSDGEDGGRGGFVKTRHQRANEKAERRAAAVQGPVTVDVDALWNQMMGDSGTSSGQPETQNQTDLSSLATAAMLSTAAGNMGTHEINARDDSAPIERTDLASAPSTARTEMIKIKRTYNFAGQVHIEEKIVARDSAEARLYLAEVGADNVEILTLGGDRTETDGTGGVYDDNSDSHSKRPAPRKAFRSAFEPVLDPSLVQAGARSDLDLGLAARLQAREQTALQRQQQSAHEQAKKLTTVEKSRMDWAGFVDREGIQDELAVAGKSKGAFVDRQQFLARTEMRREEEARRARMVSKV
ncbi:swr complex subunit [Sporothrix epigloea]|uniref:SWR1-complex protein 5 n=1 Tax=Sporothrix epigloea TaxID=1892477 RepID=A0ABP0E2T1_9PEZI